MDQFSKDAEQREMLRLAQRLRASAASTGDSAYVDLFLRAAASLEDHAALVNSVPGGGFVGNSGQ